MRIPVSRSTAAKPFGLIALVPLLLAGTLALSPPTSAAVSPGSWVKDTVHSLDIFSPDAASEYYFNGYGTEDGARTIIRGEVPQSRYWSFTIYPSKAHVHDTEVHTDHGRFTLTIASSCHGVNGTCLASSSSDPSGIVLMRVYVPVDLNGAGTGGVPLPSITWVSPKGTALSLTEASGSSAVAFGLAVYRREAGTLPASITRTYPPAVPVPTPVTLPAPKISEGGSGAFANPDNDYQRVHMSMTRGNLIVSAEAPTYATDSFAHLNNLNRPASKSPDVRYWSLCVDFVGNYTGACLRDEQIHVTADHRFTVVVAPACPVAGYVNCIPSGPVPLARALLYRTMLPTKSFHAHVFSGPYSLTATYVAGPANRFFNATSVISAIWNHPRQHLWPAVSRLHSCPFAHL